MMDGQIPWPEICAAGYVLVLDNGEIPHRSCTAEGCSRELGHNGAHGGRSNPNYRSRGRELREIATGLNPNRSGRWW